MEVGIWSPGGWNLEPWRLESGALEVRIWSRGGWNLEPGPGTRVRGPGLQALGQLFGALDCELPRIWFTPPVDLLLARETKSD